ARARSRRRDGAGALSALAALRQYRAGGSDGRAEPAVFQFGAAAEAGARCRPRGGWPGAAAQTFFHAPRDGHGRRPAASGEGRAALDRTEEGMPHILRACVVVLILVAGAVAAEPTMKRFISDEGRFSVALPGEPRVLYMVTYSDPPEDEVIADAQGRLDEIAANATRGSKILSDKKISLGGVPGRALVYRDEKNQSFDQRVYIAGNRIYVLSVMRPHGVSPKHAHEFLESFRIARRK